MEFRDNCAICRSTMTRKQVVRVLPCRHLLHGPCVELLFGQVDNARLCPICRQDCHDQEAVERRRYKVHSNRDRERIVTCANKGNDWGALAKDLGINYKTASNWIRSGRQQMITRGGKKPKSLTEAEIDVIISWVEQDSTITLKAIKQKFHQEFRKDVSVSTIGNYLEGRQFTMKNNHYEPVAMNTVENKAKRAEYVRRLNNFIQEGKQIIWIDQTNFNLFCRRSRGRARRGDRSVQQLPASKGPNVHLIGAITAAGVVTMDRQRGSFTAETANNWIRQVMDIWQNQGNQLEDLVIVCDNAPCHSHLEEAINETNATLLRLAPYSPMLNPIENIWSKIKSFVKANLRVPVVGRPGVIEQRLQYLEGIIDEAKQTIVGGDCARAAQHSTIHHATALAQENMAVGR